MSNDPEHIDEVPGGESGFHPDRWCGGCEVWCGGCLQCRDCGAPWNPVRRGECSKCGSDAGTKTRCECGSDAVSLNPDEVVVHTPDGCTVESRAALSDPTTPDQAGGE